MRLIDLIFISAFTSSVAQASLSCDVMKALNSPTLVANEKFWSDYGELHVTGHVSESHLIELLNKYGVRVEKEKVPVASGRLTSLNRQNYVLTSKATKDVEKLPNHLRTKFNEFLTEVDSGSESLKNLTSQPGRWGLEKLADTFGANAYSVRLNSGYRVAFRREKDGHLEIFDVTKSTTHFN